jgi:hypothetical protein
MWDHEGGHVGFDLAWVESIVLVFGNEVGGPHHMQGRHARGPRDQFKEPSGFHF